MLNVCSEAHAARMPSAGMGSSDRPTGLLRRVGVLTGRHGVEDSFLRLVDTGQGKDYGGLGIRLSSLRAGL